MLSLFRSRRALAGVEFALIAPVLVVLLLGMVDICRAVIMMTRLTVAADAVATIASTEAVQASNLSVLTPYQAYAATTAPFAIFPTWLASKVSVNNSFAITLSEVNFTVGPSGCTTNCSYVANMSWSVANPSGQAQLRSCGTLAAAANNLAPKLTALPSSTFGATSVFVADVSQQFTPLFTSVFKTSFKMQQTVYVSPRVNNAVMLLPGYVGPVVICPPASA